MQVIGDEQDTLENVLRLTLGSGDWVGLTAQDEPFQLSAIGRLMPFLVTNPTALQPMVNCVVLQDTLENSLMLPAGTFAFCTDQLVPVQRSASGTTLFDALTKSPTAVQAFATVQSTPLRCGPRPPFGVAMLWIDQTVPFQTSAQLWVLSEPTASHEEEDVHASPLSCAVVDPLGAGTVFSVQDVPFHCSANGVCFPPELVQNPTAVHAFTDAHETLIKKLRTAPTGLGV